MPKVMVIAGLLLTLVVGFALAAPPLEEAERVTPADEPALIPFGPTESRTYVNESGHLVKISTQRYLSLRDATPEEVKFLADFTTSVRPLPGKAQTNLLKAITPPEVLDRVTMFATTCKGTCSELCGVKGCDVSGTSCTALVCDGPNCPPPNSNHDCEKTSTGGDLPLPD